VLRPTREFQVFQLTSDLHETTRTHARGARGSTREDEPVSSRVGARVDALVPTSRPARFVFWRMPMRMRRENFGDDASPMGSEARFHIAVSPRRDSVDVRRPRNPRGSASEESPSTSQRPRISPSTRYFRRACFAKRVHRARLYRASGDR